MALNVTFRRQWGFFILEVFGYFVLGSLTNQIKLYSDVLRQLLQKDLRFSQQ